VRRNFPVTNGKLASHEMYTEYINAVLGNVIKNETEKESKKSENVSFYTPGVLCVCVCVCVCVCMCGMS